MKFIESVDMNLSGKNIKVLGGMYEALELRFSGTNEAAQNITAADLGHLNFYYRGKQRGRIALAELQTYNSKFGGTFEETRNVGGAFAFTFFLPFHHQEDIENVLYLPGDELAYLEWTPTAGLAANVVAASAFRVVGVEKLGRMKYIYSFWRRDISMVVGETTPEVLTPFNIVNAFIEFNANIDNVDLTIDGDVKEKSSEIVELLNYDHYKNRTETYAQSGYAHINLVKGGRISETMNNTVQLILRGSAADTISVFWTSLDYQIADLEKSTLVLKAKEDAIGASKIIAGGASPVAVWSALQNQR